MKYETSFGSTPLDPDEKSLLIPSHINTMEELNAQEHANIFLAEKWAFTSKFDLSAQYTKKLHKKMFDRTWQWAGNFRKTEKNIGIDAYKIPTELTVLFQDTLFQMDQFSYGMDEIATRLHHRLVSIHPFPNGNGRHARLMTDLFLLKNGCPRFSWGSAEERHPDNSIRKKYIEALRHADRYDITLLLTFVRS